MDQTHYRVIFIGRTLDGGCFPLCLWISKPDNVDNSSWQTVKSSKDRNLLEVNVRVSDFYSTLLIYVKL